MAMGYRDNKQHELTQVVRWKIAIDSERYYQKNMRLVLESIEPSRTIFSRASLSRYDGYSAFIEDVEIQIDPEEAYPNW